MKNVKIVISVAIYKLRAVAIKSDGIPLTLRPWMPAHWPYLSAPSLDEPMSPYVLCEMISVKDSCSGSSAGETKLLDILKTFYTFE
jgi:hypothetical protein